MEFLIYGRCGEGMQRFGNCLEVGVLGLCQEIIEENTLRTPHPPRNKAEFP